MFYGFFQPGTKRRSYTPHRDKYRPWDQGSYRGVLVCKNEERSWRIERCFDKDNETVNVYDDQTGDDLTLDFPYNPVTRQPQVGEKLLGLSKTAFNNTANIAQMSCASVSREADFSAEVNDKLLSVMKTADASLSLSAVIHELDSRIEQIGSPKKSKTPYGQACQLKKELEEELEERVRFFKSEDKLLEAQRIAERTKFDIEMMRETGFCSGIENYSRHLSGLKPGEPPHTLLDYFPDDYLIIVDESHITIPQVRGMYAGDRSRKQTLVDYGFRLPSALDNRPLNFEEFESKIDQMLFVSATPNVYENEHELLRVEQIIRPTGLLDPEISVRPVEGQIDDLIGEVNKETKNHHKVLITTLTKRMAEDLTQYMGELGIRVKYLHSDIDTLERAEIIRDLRLDVFDVLVGINLLREGLDIPEITLVAILDADKEGFLRSETSLIQTIGRAARNSEGHVIMYADKITDSMRVAIDETERRRKLQQAYNEEHGITPKTIQKSVRDLIAISKKVAAEEMEFDKDPESMSRRELEKLIGDIQKKMKKAAAELNFEAAAEYRDKMVKLKNMLRDIEE